MQRRVMSELQIYVLELQGGKWYVGKTKNIEKRFKKHSSGEGSVWTRAHKPISIKETSPGDEFDEDKITKKYMSKYGIDNVRGGSYVAMELTLQQKRLLQTEINMAMDKCAFCGVGGHFVKDCPAKQPSAAKCGRCNRSGHTADKCYAKTDKSGKTIAKPPACTRCGREGHLSEECYARTKSGGDVIKNANNVKNKPVIESKTPSAAPYQYSSYSITYNCLNCGGSGHDTKNCFVPPKVEFKSYAPKIKCRKCGSEDHTSMNCFIIHERVNLMPDNDREKPVEDISCRCDIL